MKLLATFATTMLFTTLAHAAPVAENQAIEALNLSPLTYLGAFATPTMPQACTDANFTPEQKTAMKNEMYQSDRRAVTLKANLKLAMMDYGHVIMDTAMPITDAQTAATSISTSMAAIASNKLDLMNTLLYTVLTPEQRAPAIECFMTLEKQAMEKKLAKVCAKLPKP